MDNLIVFFDNCHTVIHNVDKTKNLDDLLKISSESANKDVNSITGHSFLETEELNKLYQPALIFKNGRIYTDRQKIIQDKLELIRITRNNFLKELDVQRKIAEDNQNQNEIKLLKEKIQKLRDLPNLIKWEKLKTDKEILDYNPFEDKEIFN